MTHSSAVPLPPLPTPPTVPVLLICQPHTGTALPICWKLYLICQTGRPHGSRCLPLSSTTHATSLPGCAAPRRRRLCWWVLRYLMAGTTCHYCDIHAFPFCLSSPAGTIWPDSLHADGWTIVGWMISHSQKSQA